MSDKLLNGPVVDNKSLGPVEIDLATAVSVIHQIQMASRLPENYGIGSKFAGRFARELQAMVSKVSPEWGEVMEFGWEPDPDNE